MQHKILKLALRLFYQPFIIKYLQKDHYFTHKGIKVMVKKDVFHPGLYQANTRIFLRFLEALDLEEKRVLELGAGSGLIALFAAKKGGIVTASDISRTAIENITLNASLNNLKITTIHSDLFEKIPAQKFDFIVITPPYFKARPLSDRDYGWYAGENLEYFTRLFKQLPPFIQSGTKVFMILAETCNLELLKASVEIKDLHFRQVYQKKILFERNTIYEITQE